MDEERDSTEEYTRKNGKEKCLEISSFDPVNQFSFFLGSKEDFWNVKLLLSTAFAQSQVWRIAKGITF